MTSECIHGFEGTQCDICFPAAAPERPAVARPAASRTVRRTAPVRASTPAVSTAETRIHLALSITELTSVLDGGAITPQNALVHSLASELGRELRDSADVAGRPASAFVPFSLDPAGGAWEQVRHGATGPQWADAARRSVPADFVVLVSTLARVGEEVVVADGDASGSLTRLARTTDDIRRMLGRLRDDPDARSSAEVLVPDAVPFEAIQLIGVANDPAKDRVRALLTGHGLTTRVAVYPPWFATD